MSTSHTDSPSSSLDNDVTSPLHPLYLHPNDHPGLLLISKKLQGSENYSTWKRSILIALSAKKQIEAD